MKRRRRVVPISFVGATPRLTARRARPILSREECFGGWLSPVPRRLREMRGLS